MNHRRTCEADPAADTALLRRAGSALLGEQWQRPLARLLSERDPQRGNRPAGVDDRLMRRCAAGQRPVPSWWWPLISALLQERWQELREEQAEVSAALFAVEGSKPANGVAAPQEEDGA